jgi:hypothetical protein
VSFPCPFFLQCPKQLIGDRKPLHPVDASDFSEAESEVVTACLEAIERKYNNRTFEENVTA